jgi:hypothetical protein
MLQGIERDDVRVGCRFQVAPDMRPVPICVLRVLPGALMDLYLFRLSLKERQQQDLFAKFGEPRMPREDWIREFFSERREFVHSKNQLVFVPEAPGPSFPPNLIAGWIARPKVLQEWTPPDEGLIPTHHESWRVALILIDPTEHEDGQKVALEQHDDIGGAHPVVKSLVRAMSERGPYSVEVFPIIQESSFWRFAEKHSYQIKSLTFDVAVPNMFDGPDDFASELRKLRDKNNAHTVRTTLTSDGSLDTKAENIAPIIDYTEKGAGAIRAKAVDGTPYNSRDHAKRVKLDIDRKETGGEGFWSRLMHVLDQVF